MQDIAQLASQLRESRSNEHCTRGAGPHRCDLTGCPREDPLWVHHCYADDCDFTELEWTQVTNGQITLPEFSRLGFNRAFERANGYPPPDATPDERTAS